MNRNVAPQTSTDTKIPYIIPQKLVLDNGLSLYLMEGGSEDLVKIELVLFCGSYYQDKPLLAHATGNLLRNGTTGRSAREINEKLDQYGSFFYADVSKDIASFSVFVLQKHLVSILPLFAEMIREPSFPDDEIQLFLSNQKQQHIINMQRVQYVARMYFNELLFGNNHPYGYRVESSDFDRLGREKMLEFHSEYYHPGNAFCIVSGRPPKDIGEQLALSLGSASWASKQKSTPPAYMAVSASEKKVLVHRPNALQSSLRIGRRLFNRTHPDYHKLMITNSLLGGYFGSRLMQNIRQAKGYTYGIGSSLVSLLKDGYFFISAEVGADVCQKALAEVYQELRNLRTIPATEEELKTLKAYLSGDFIRSFDGPFSQSQRFKELMAFRMDISHYDAFLSELNAITPQQIMQTAEKYLHEDSMMELVVGRK